MHFIIMEGKKQLCNLMSDKDSCIPYVGPDVLGPYNLPFVLCSSPLALLTSSVTQTDNAALLCRDYHLTSCLGPLGTPYCIILSTASALRVLHFLCVCVCSTKFHTPLDSAKVHCPASLLIFLCLGKTLSLHSVVLMR